MSIEEGIKTVYGGGWHAVILGAGASIASTRRNPEKYGKKLPSMDNFIEVVGLTEIVKRLPKELQATNFETLYSRLYADNPESEQIKEIEWIVQEYFRHMKLPDEPTIYDYLVLSLRSKDLIATFNWDPFLFQAFSRNRHVGEMPYLSFLHGNVAIGYSKEDKRCGPAGWYSKATKNYFAPTKLLYPVTQKNYTDDEFISMEWDRLKWWLNHDKTVRVTIFGYGAPATDVEAVKLLNDSWGTGDERNMEQFEIIDIRPEDEVRNQWDNFIHSHHYDYAQDFFNSAIALNPRRTGESYFHHYLPESPAQSFRKSNPVPQNFKTLDEMWAWYKPLIDAEEEWKKKSD